jgi:hypothetical protein
VIITAVFVLDVGCIVGIAVGVVITRPRGRHRRLELQQHR